MGAFVVGDGGVVDEKEARRAEELMVLLGLYRFGLAWRRLLLDWRFVLVVIIIVIASGDPNFEDCVEICFDLVVVVVVVVGGRGRSLYVVLIFIFIFKGVGNAVGVIVIVVKLAIAEFRLSEFFE
jgi:hypothetical protein